MSRMFSLWNSHCPMFFTAPYIHSFLRVSEVDWGVFFGIFQQRFVLKSLLLFSETSTFSLSFNSEGKPQICLNKVLNREETPSYLITIKAFACNKSATVCEETGNKTRETRQVTELAEEKGRKWTLRYIEWSWNRTIIKYIDYYLYIYYSNDPKQVSKKWVRQNFRP